MGQHLPRRPRLALATAVVSAIGVCGAAVPVMASPVTASPASPTGAARGVAAVAAARVPTEPVRGVAAVAAARVPTEPSRAVAAVAAARVPTTAPVLLINGDRLRAVRGQDGVAMALTPGNELFSLFTLGFGRHVQVIPTDALPYLGRGLDPGLFDLAALRRAELGGRLPLHVTFPGQRPRLPGLTATRSGAGYADGYLTASGARAFGAALARQYLGDHARASFGRGGLFGGGMKITLAGAPVAAPAARPASTMDTLIMSAANLHGRPDNGDAVIVHNEDNPGLLGASGGETGVFHHGTATFSVPAGHYWAEGAFADGRATRLVVLPQFTVRGSTTVHLAERSASSRVAFSTPRPAALRMTNFTLFRGAGNGDLFISGWSGSGTSPLWVSPTTSKPTVGTLDSDTAAQLTSSPGVTGTPYAYNLAYPGPKG